MDYEKKYLKYKSKYNLKKSSLLRGGGAIMKGGSITAISDLVFRNVPMINRTDILFDNKIRIGPIGANGFTPTTITWYDTQIKESDKKTILSINEEWKPYIHFNTPVQVHAQYDVTISVNIDPTDPEHKPYNLNTLNARGQTLLFVAALNCNKITFDALVAMGVKFLDKNSDDSLKKDGEGHIIGANMDNSTILHGIAWGKTDASDKPTKTYDEKVAFIQYIIARHPDTILLLFLKNSRQETMYDNLLMRHPDKMSLSLYPLRWVRDRDRSKLAGDEKEYYFFNMDIENSDTYKHPST
jgi:hypothetical protein